MFALSVKNTLRFTQNLWLIRNYTNNMASENAKAVANEVLGNIGKGQKISIAKIARGKGYSRATANNPKLITETKSYQDIVNPFLDKMSKERDRIIVAMSRKKLSKEQYRNLVDGLDKLTKNIQLLGGKPTENNKLEITWE